MVTLADGSSYAGMLEQADVTRDPEYRDIVLLEPARYEEATGNYRATSLQYMYLRGDKLASIAGVADLTKDKRVTTIDEYIFPREDVNDEQRPTTEADPAAEA